MQNKYNVRLHLRSGEVIECHYISRLRSYAGVLKEMYNQTVTGFMRKNSTKNGVLCVNMREVVAVEVYDI